MPTRFNENLFVDGSGLERVSLLIETFPQRSKRVIRDSIISTINVTYTELIRQITSKYDITEGSLLANRRAKTIIKKVYPPVTRDWVGVGYMDGSIQVTGNRMPLMRFNISPQQVPNQKGIPVSARTPVSITVRMGNTKVGNPNMFLAKMQSGHLGVYRRKKEVGTYHIRRPDGQNSEQPIDETFAISAAEMVKGKRIREPLRKFMEEKFDMYLRKNIEKMFTRVGIGGGGKV